MKNFISAVLLISPLFSNAISANDLKPTVSTSKTVEQNIEAVELFAENMRAQGSIGAAFPSEYEDLYRAYITFQNHHNVRLEAFLRTFLGLTISSCTVAASVILTDRLMGGDGKVSLRSSAPLNVWGLLMLGATSIREIYKGIHDYRKNKQEKARARDTIIKEVARLEAAGLTAR